MYWKLLQITKDILWGFGEMTINLLKDMVELEL